MESYNGSNIQSCCVSAFRQMEVGVDKRKQKRRVIKAIDEENETESNQRSLKDLGSKRQ